MYSEIYKNAVDKGNKTVFRGLTVTCPICGREFGCNKTYHVYTALVLSLIHISEPTRPY